MRRYGFPTRGHRHAGGFRVPQGAGRQPRRDRHPGVPGRLRARHRARWRSSRYEDRNSLHRLKADEAYEIGEPRPPGPRLPVGRRDRRGGPAGRRRRHLPRLRLPVREPATWRRPAPRPASPSSGRPPEVLELAGNKARAVAAARAAGLPVLRSSDPVRGRRRAASPPPTRSATRCSSRRSPAAAGAACAGSTSPADLPEAIDAAMREAESAFGDPTVFLEQAVRRTRGTSRCRSSPTRAGDVVHLYERDCSVQRRHQKVIEIAPAPDLDPRSAGPDLRRRGRVRPAHRLRQRRHRRVPGRRGAAQHVFIEMNPRIQVEHTVTEEVTDVDLVQAQLRIAAGETLADLGLRAGGHPAARAPRCSAGSPPRTRPTGSARTPA